MVVSNSCSSQHQACDSRGRFCFRRHDFLQPTAPSLSCPSATPIPAWCTMGNLCLCCTSREHAGSRGPEIPSDIPARLACPPPIPADIPPMPARPPPIPPNIPPMPTRPPPIPDTPTPEPLHMFFGRPQGICSRQILPWCTTTCRTCTSLWSLGTMAWNRGRNDGE